MSNRTPCRMAFNTVCEAARAMGFILVVGERRTWLIKGLKWHAVATNKVAEWLCALRPMDAPSEAKNGPNVAEAVIEPKTAEL